MKIGVPKEIKTNENRIALVPGRRRVARRCRTHGAHRDGRRARQRLQRRGLHGGRRDDRPRCRDGVEGQRHDHEGEGADQGRVAAHEEGPGDLHLLPLRRRQGADPRPPQERRDLRRLRDGGAAVARAAAAHADVGSRGTHGGAGRREVPREALRRPRRAARRRAGRGAGQGRHPRRRHRRHQRGEDGRGAWAPRSSSSTSRSSGCAT